MNLKNCTKELFEKSKQFIQKYNLPRYKRDFLFWPSLIILCIWGLFAKSDRTETIVFAAIAAFFTYKSYLSSEEKFRLKLFEQRFKIYEELIVFCSNVVSLGRIPSGSTVGDEHFKRVKRLYDAADNSFRGFGYHKSAALFGPEVHELLVKINKTYAWLQAFNERPPAGTPGHIEWPTEFMNHLNFLYSVCTDLPIILRPYVYFGDVKNPDLSINLTTKDKT